MAVVVVAIRMKWLMGPGVTNDPKYILFTNHGCNPCEILGQSRVLVGRRFVLLPLLIPGICGRPPSMADEGPVATNLSSAGVACRERGKALGGICGHLATTPLDLSTNLRPNSAVLSTHGSDPESHRNLKHGSFR